MIRVFVNQWREGPAVFRYGKRYFLINSKCAGWAFSAARYAVAPSMLGPWKEMGNPAVGTGAEKTFDSQSSDVLQVAGKRGAYIFLADRWKPDDLINSPYVWLPISIDADKLEIKWRDEWNLSSIQIKARPGANATKWQRAKDKSDKPSVIDGGA